MFLGHTVALDTKANRMAATSEIARQEHELSGKASTNRERIFRLAIAKPDSTAGEIYRAATLMGWGISRHEVSRRLPELRKAGRLVNGEVRRCEVLGSKSMTWTEPKPATKKQAAFAFDSDEAVAS